MMCVCVLLFSPSEFWVNIGKAVMAHANQLLLEQCIQTRSQHPWGKSLRARLCINSCLVLRAKSKFRLMRYAGSIAKIV